MRIEERKKEELWIKEYLKDRDLDGIIDKEDILPDDSRISTYEDLEKKEKEHKDEIRR